MSEKSKHSPFTPLVSSAIVQRNVKWLFLSNAIINWTISIPGIVDPVRAAGMFGGVEPNYPSIIRLWQGFVFMFGCLFWEVSRNVARKSALIKYNWIEKSITAVVLTAGYFLGDIPQRLMVLILFTNWLWIPFIIWADVAVGKQKFVSAEQLAQPHASADPR